MNTVTPQFHACDLRVNLLREPLCVRRAPLCLSWRLAADPDDRDLTQTAYRITVTQGLAGAVIYDSDWIASDAACGVSPAGLSDALFSGILYYVRVTLRDSIGRETSPSAPVPLTVEEDNLSPTGIWAASDESDIIPDRAILRHAFSLSAAELAATDRALMTVTASSPERTRQFVYDLTCNGESIGLGPCRYGRTPDGRETLTYQTYDITPTLRAGENVLSAVCYALSEHGFYARLDLFDKNGHRRTLTDTVSDTAAWRALAADRILGHGHNIGTSYFTAHAYDIDARIYPGGFDCPGFVESELVCEDGTVLSWHTPVAGGSIGGGRCLLPGEYEPPRRFDAPTDAVTVSLLRNGDFLIDLGAEIVGGLRLTLTADASHTVTLGYGEQVIREDGIITAVKSRMNTGNRYVETWTLRAGVQTLESRSLMTYRYVQISGYAASLTPTDVCGVEIRKPFDVTAGTLVTDHALLADLYRLTKHTVRVTSQDIYVDSQSRERGAYEGDLLINMLAAYAMEDDYAPARLTADYLLGHRTWPADYLLTIIYAARADYMATGDPRLIAAWYDTLKANLFTSFLDDTGLIHSPNIGSSSTNAVLVDWPPSERDGYEMNAPYNTVFNALCVRAYDDMAAIASVLGEGEDSAEFTARATSLRCAMIDRLYDSDAGEFRDGLRADGTPSPHAAQHATAYALYAGIYDTPEMADRLAARIARDGALRTSVYAAFFLLDGLYRTGHGELANRLLLAKDVSEGARTWAYMLYTMGATVTTEAWNETNKPNMTLSHPWGAAPAHLIATGLFGIIPTTPGYATFSVTPTPSVGLSVPTTLTLPTLRGQITATLSSDSLTLTVPPCAEADVRLPDGTHHVVGSGCWKWCF